MSPTVIPNAKPPPLPPIPRKSPTPLVINNPIAVAPPPMLSFGDDLDEWMLVARTYLRQVPTEQHTAGLYPLLKTDLYLHVDAMLDSGSPTVEATFEGIQMAFEAVQPLQDHRADFFSRRQQPGESLHSPSSQSLPHRETVSRDFLPPVVRDNRHSTKAKLFRSSPQIHTRCLHTCDPTEPAYPTPYAAHPTWQGTISPPLPPTWQGPIPSPPPPTWQQTTATHHSTSIILWSV